MNVEGTITHVLEPITGDGRNGTWTKQDFVIETDGEYPKSICLTIWGKVIDAVGELNVGDRVDASIEISSREYNDRWYTDVKAWKLLVEAGDAPPPAAQPEDDYDEELPF